MEARPFRRDQLPNGKAIDNAGCINCHLSAAGGDSRNPFGQTVAADFVQGAAGNVTWIAELAWLDSDGDGFTNGEELQDPTGVWRIGDPDPGKANLVSNPGDPGSMPSSGEMRRLVLNFKDMTPHIGQKIELRIVDKADESEAGRSMRPSVPGAEFSIALNALEIGHSYWIDFYADLSGNGRYDAPPADHAWRLEVNNVQDHVTLDFTHNVNLTDIMWPADGLHDFTLRLNDMTPHVGQLFELRIVDRDSDEEVARRSIPEIQNAVFEVNIAAILSNEGNYHVDFYADLSGNGSYDAPPADHAWRLDINGVEDDVTLDFTHNVNLTDIMWPAADLHDFTLQLNEMTPHVGQLFELRIVDRDSDEEVARRSIPEIQNAAFNVDIPAALVHEGNYRVDFYADLSGNGSYDAPPADHAWRLDINGVEDDVTLEFTHNVNLTDIMWPVQDEAPYDFRLNLTDMTPHVGQLFELRVVDADSDEEVARRSIPAIESAAFEIELPDILEESHNYNVDFYADLSGNGEYDAPPADHAWRLTINDAHGPIELDFTHNVNLVDIQWPGATDVNDVLVGDPRALIIRPNPVSEATTIRFELTASSLVELHLFDLHGRLAWTRSLGYRDVGVHEFQWSGPNRRFPALTPGTYLLRVQAGKDSRQQQVLWSTR